MVRNKKLLVLIGFLIISSILMVACDTGSKDVDGETGEREEVETINIEHKLGKTEIDKNPEKVVVFDYGVLDILDTIDVDIVGLPKGSLPDYLDKYQDEEYTDVGSLKEPNFETIYELSPDLIIISGRQADMYDEFEKIAPTLYLEMTQGEYIESFKYNGETLGEIFGKEDLVAKEIEEVEEEIEKLNEKAESMDKTALFVMANDGNISAYGLGSRFGVLYDEFGLKAVDENIDSSTHGQKISFEYIVEKDPDYLYVMDRAAVTGGDISAKQVMDNDLIKGTKAYENDNIVYLDAHVWYVTSGGIYGTKKMVEEVQTSLE